jgi:hypothetical protein
LTGRATPGVRSESRELPPRPDASDQLHATLCSSGCPTGRSGPGDPQTCWSHALPLRLGELTRRAGQARPASGHKTLGALRLSPRLELTGRVGPPWTASGPASGHCFSVRNTPDLRLHFSASDTVENRRFTSQKALNPASQARREGERNPNPSVSLKLHRLRKCANTTKCTPPCACVLAFHKHFFKALC